MNNIKDWIAKLISNDSTVSSMRVMSLLCTITACVVALTIKDSASIIAALLAPAMAGKVIQKGME